MVYTLWDAESANIINAFATEREALEEVRLSVEEFGRGYARSWGLAVTDERDRPVAIASGDELIDRAFDAVPQ